MNVPLSPAASPVIAALLRPDAYPHPAENVEMLETHISWVFLAGAYAYKIKKPVDLGFVDFTTLEKRRHFCEDELRLNRRLAPQIYVDMVEIRGSPEGLHIGGPGPVAEYALRMHRFPQEALATRMLADGRLTRELVERLGRRLARFHADLVPAPPDLPYATTAAILREACQNFDQIAAMLPEPHLDHVLVSIRDWTEREFILRYSEFHERREAGMTRECHGDLHLRNIVELDGELVPFDCIEFNAALRWTDVMNEVAFLFMDLLDCGADALAWRFLNAYLEANGVYSGLSVLRFYVVYRAMVRAKVHLIRACQGNLDRAEASRLRSAYQSYLALAQRCTTLGQPAILLMHGFCASGKSTMALSLAQELGGLRLRSDVERKRLHGLSPLAQSHSTVSSGLYGQDATQATYARLAQAARIVVTSGYTAIVDASFLRRAHRAALRDLATSMGVPIALIDVSTPQALLRTRIMARVARANDPSEASLAVLEHQLATAEPVAEAEDLPVVALDGRRALDVVGLATVLHVLFGARRRAGHGPNPSEAALEA
ncbi:MAG TPA: AAA family ATPase [Burkholderiales bacterium]|nr:AAA family ATPase [Burkholderiales bacterium]